LLHFFKQSLAPFNMILPLGKLRRPMGPDSQSPLHRLFESFLPPRLLLYKLPSQLVLCALAGCGRNPRLKSWLVTHRSPKTNERPVQAPLSAFVHRPRASQPKLQFSSFGPRYPRQAPSPPCLATLAPSMNCPVSPNAGFF
jgi:hypothetical protein